MTTDIDDTAAATARRVGRRERVLARLPVLGVISAGGGLGALARYGMSLLLPSEPDGFPWATFTTNLTGCFLMGVLMVLITDVWSAHRLLRPFLGVGFLGGYTTFSTYAVEFRALLRPGAAGTAFAYLVGTPVAALVAVLIAVALARRATGVVRRRGD